MVRVSAVIIKDRRILLCKRPMSHTLVPGAWGVPGGILQEHGTPLIELVTTKVKDQLGGDFVPQRKLWFYEEIKDDIHEINHVFLGVLKGTIAPNTEKVVESMWVSFDDLEELDLAFSTFEITEDLHAEGLID